MRAKSQAGPKGCPCSKGWKKNLHRRQIKREEYHKRSGITEHLGSLESTETEGVFILS